MSTVLTNEDDYPPEGEFDKALRLEAEKWIEAYFSGDVDRQWVTDQITKLPSAQAAYVAAKLYRRVNYRRKELTVSHGDLPSYDLMIRLQESARKERSCRLS